MSKIEDQEQVPPVTPWVGGRARPSTPQWQGWSEPKSGIHLKEGWSIQEQAVENCHPKSRRSAGDVLYRVFPPASTKHVGSFTLLNRAKAWVEARLEQRGSD